jgi:hypothetical protein
MHLDNPDIWSRHYSITFNQVSNNFHSVMSLACKAFGEHIRLGHFRLRYRSKHIARYSPFLKIGSRCPCGCITTSLQPITVCLYQ